MKINKTIDIIGIANPIEDLDIHLKQLPPTNTNNRMDEFCFMGGGNVTTALTVCGVLGLKSHILGLVGDDMFGKANIRDFRYNHVDTSHLIVDKGKTTNFCVCVTESAIGGKEFISKAGSCRQLEVEDIDASFIQSSKMIHIGFFTPAIAKACDFIHASGGEVSIDAAYYKPEIYEHYGQLDVFIGSETYYDSMLEAEGKMSFNEAVKHIQEQGPNVVIFTFGSKGCRGCEGDHYFEVPARKVEVQDSTGAGDVFHGAFDYGWIQGWNAEKASQFATAVSAIKCTRMGGRAGIADRKTVEKYLETGIIDYSVIDQRVQRYQRGFLGTDD